MDAAKHEHKFMTVTFLSIFASIELFIYAVLIFRLFEQRDLESISIVILIFDS